MKQVDDTTPEHALMRSFLASCALLASILHAAPLSAAGPAGFSELPPAGLPAPAVQPPPTVIDEADGPPPMAPPPDAGAPACCDCDGPCTEHGLLGCLGPHGGCPLCAPLPPMPPHYAYGSPWDRYYYFRSYNFLNVAPMQAIVASWGQDPRNIADNRFFKQIYKDVGSQRPSDLPYPEPQILPPGEQIAPPPAPTGRRGRPLKLLKAPEKPGPTLRRAAARFDSPEQGPAGFSASARP